MQILIRKLISKYLLVSLRKCGGDRNVISYYLNVVGSVLEFDRVGIVKCQKVKLYETIMDLNLNFA